MEIVVPGRSDAVAVSPALHSIEYTRKQKAVRMYRVKNIFRTVQGEGFWAGRPAVFVRMVGCNMWSGYEADRERDAERSGAACPLWCDTAFTKEGSTAYRATELVLKMVEAGGGIRFCVLTGGEPFLQADAHLIRTLHAAGFTVAIETNGTVPIIDAFWDAEAGCAVPPDWIVCSPKLPEEQLKLELFDELKLVVPDYEPSAYASFAALARKHVLFDERVPLLWLQPEDGPRAKEATELAVNWALDDPAWRVSVQTHKVLGVE